MRSASLGERWTAGRERSSTSLGVSRLAVGAFVRGMRRDAHHAPRARLGEPHLQVLEPRHGQRADRRASCSIARPNVTSGDSALGLLVVGASPLTSGLSARGHARRRSRSEVGLARAAGSTRIADCPARACGESQVSESATRWRRLQDGALRASPGPRDVGCRRVATRRAGASRTRTTLVTPGRWKDCCRSRSWRHYDVLDLRHVAPGGLRCFLRGTPPSRASM